MKNLKHSVWNLLKLFLWNHFSWEIYYYYHSFFSNRWTPRIVNFQWIIYRQHNQQEVNERIVYSPFPRWADVDCCRSHRNFDISMMDIDLGKNHRNEIVSLAMVSLVVALLLLAGNRMGKNWKNSFLNYFRIRKWKSCKDFLLYDYETN